MIKPILILVLSMLFITLFAEEIENNLETQLVINNYGTLVSPNIKEVNNYINIPTCPKGMIYNQEVEECICANPKPGGCEDVLPSSTIDNRLYMLFFAAFGIFIALYFRENIIKNN